MNQRSIFRRLYGHSGGSAGAEFVLVLPIVLIFLLGMIDVGRYMWSINQLEKATQIGARMAVVTDMVASDLSDENFGETLGQGAAIPASSFGQMHCDKFNGSLQCACDADCGDVGMTADADAFQNIVDRMHQIAPMVNDTNVRITYTNSGLGYAGDPNGPDVAPIVTVRTNNIDFNPFVFLGFATGLPNESASLTLEDSAGTTSN